jgi:uncharacterized protein with PIN domain
VKHLDLFSGIGGFSLAALSVWGAEYENVGFCEIDRYCQELLKIRFPGSVIYDDIKTLTVDKLVNQCYDVENKSQEAFMGARRKDYDEAVKMYNSGLSIDEVAEFYGITRQAMHKILIRRNVSFRDNKKFGEENHFHRGTSASDKSQNTLEKAIMRGIVARKTHCEKCNDSGSFKDGRTKIQAHHSDYNKPLDVMWLCQKCHHDWHKVNKPIARVEVAPEEPVLSVKVDLLTGGFPR